MKFSCMIWPFSGSDIDPVVRLAQSAENCGFETVYIGDSQMIWNDVWVTLTACALNTTRVRLGPGVTNTVTRHPAVTANAINSLNIVSHGRAVLGVGAGDSAVRTAGLSPSSLAQIRERIEFMKALLDGAEVDALRSSEESGRETWGRVDRIRLLGAGAAGPVPIQLACMGPKSVHLAGEICDGVIVDGHMGGNGEGARATVAAAREGAESAGRRPAGLRFIAAIDAAIGEDRHTALDKVRPTAARNIARKPWLPDTLGIEHADVVGRVSEAYRFYEHLDLTAKHRELIPDEVAMKCCIAGTPDDCVAKARELDEAGITEISIFLTSQDEAGSRNVLERFAAEVIPNI
ncbi:MAG: LLM class flavin-dependent oxidoreductase [Gammaproteobacteria bacterium]|jgi:5,10-methylenetetrahydromethanopterin reductase|nr:LLM class flavin-dependent oxidoreductase [Gammaproteobacteria bacterium]HJP36625.1 LLM class flavin-dependent oxidoreductase [Gammaproteobacteria bacterium]